MPKITKKIGKNDNETLKIYCNLTPLVVGNLRSIQHIWYLPKNGPKIAKKWQKRPKNRKKRQKRVILHSKICPLEIMFNGQKIEKIEEKKRGDFAHQNLPLRNDFSRLFSHTSSWPV